MFRFSSTPWFLVIAGPGLMSIANAQSVQLDLFGDAATQQIGSSIRAIEDVDGDGVPDLVVGTRSQEFQLRSGADGALIYRVSGSGFWFGWRVEVIADVDGDGIGEVVAGDPEEDHNAENTGRVTLHSGADGTPLFTVYGLAAGDGLGTWFSRAGDVNADGFEDLLLGAPHVDTAVGANAGFVRVVSGLDGSLLFELQGEHAEDRFGQGLAPAGDVNGDGFADFVVGSPRHGPPLGTGKIELFAGPAGVELLERVGAPAELFGWAIARVGRANADAVDDLVVGAPGYFNPVESAYVLSGSDLSILHTLSGDVPDQRFGRTVCAAGDVDGDGFDDVLVGAVDDQSYDSVSGMARVYSGATGDALFTAYGETWLANLGVGLAGVGDRDGDGHDDVAIGEIRNDEFLSNAGRVRIFAWAGGTSFTNYCVANPNSSGSPAQAVVHGTGSVGAGGLVLRAQPVPTNQTGIWFYGPSESQVPFGDGFRCVSGQVYRLGPPSSAGSSQVLLHALSFEGPPAGAGSGQILAGSTWKFQAWYRDPESGAAGFNTSDAVSVDFIP